MVERLLAASPRDLDEVHRSPSAVLWSSGEPESWSDGSRSGYLWWPAAGGLPQPRSWQESSERRLAAGLVLDPDGVVLHTDALGLNELDVRRVGDALYFSVRQDPLVELDGSPLHVDWPAWASLLMMTTPIGDQTLFSEIKHLEPATAWRAAGGRLERLGFEPSWLAAEPDRPPSPEEMVELVAAAIPRRAGPVAIGLSGGWDSRLLASLVSRRPESRLTAWTTSTDDGLDLDITCASAVAETLGLPHHLVTPGPESWLEEHGEVRLRTQYQTLHHGWAMPYARAVHGLRGPLIDGCLGDALLRSRGDHAEVPLAASHEQARKISWDVMTGHAPRHEQIWAPGVVDVLADLSLSAFHQVMRPVEGHHAMPVLARLVSHRGVFASAAWLLGPEAEVWLPFVHPDVIAGSLRVPLAERKDHAYYLAMLAHGAGEVAALPSTNDPGAKPEAGPRRTTSPAALASLAGDIAGSEEVRALLGPRLLAALGDPELRARQARWTGPLYVLQWASMLARWQARYRSRLAWEPLT